MLCNKTMRAALAPVIGLLGVVFATTVSATIDLNAEKEEGTPAYASESISSADGYNAGTDKEPLYRITATGTDLQITAETDILLEDGANYVRYDFDGAGVGFTEDLKTGFLWIQDKYDTDPNDSTPAALETTGQLAQTVAYKGNLEDKMVIFILPNSDNNGGGNDVNGYARGSRLTLDLTSSTPLQTDGTRPGERAGTGNDAWTYDLGLLGVTGKGTITAKVGVYGSLTDARNGDNAIFESDGPNSDGSKNVLKVSSAVGTPKVTPAVPPPQADVAAQVADENGTLKNEPFRRFTGSISTAAVLATTSISVNTKLLDALTGEPITESILTGVEVTATAPAGAFAVVTAEADGGDGNPWRLASSAACTDGQLALDKENGDLDMDDKKKITATGMAEATEATATLGAASAKTGYFCVTAAKNTQAIPRANGYMLKLEPQIGKDHPLKPAASEAVAAGRIDRNGTTVNLTYLTTDPFVDQRLVLVNRGGEEAMFWIDIDDYQSEEGTNPSDNQLSIDAGLSIPGNGRTVIKMDDAITLDGQLRASAILNVLAPPSNIDVMTIQRSPFTDEVDTTMYEAVE